MKLRKHSIYNSTPKIKYLGKNITKEVGRLHYKTLLKEILKDPNNWIGTPCAWIETVLLR